MSIFALIFNLVLSFAMAETVQFGYTDPVTGQEVWVKKKVKKGQTVGSSVNEVHSLFTPPLWMAKVGSCYSQPCSKGTVTGAGSLVRIGMDYFILTVAHVASGSQLTVQLPILEKKPNPNPKYARVKTGKLKLDPLNDIALIEVFPSRDQAEWYLADFDRHKERFVLSQDLNWAYGEFGNYQNPLAAGVVRMSGKYKAINRDLIVPDPLTEQKSAWEEKQPSAYNSENGLFGGYNQLGDQIVYLRMGPGASGTPLIGRDGWQMSIQGLFFRSSRDFEKAFFTSIESIANLTNDKGSPDNVTWSFANNLIFQQFPFNSSEISFFDSPAGGADGSGGGADGSGGAGFGNSSWKSYVDLTSNKILNDAGVVNGQTGIGIRSKSLLNGGPVYLDGFSLRKALDEKIPLDTLDLISETTPLIDLVRERTKKTDDKEILLKSSNAIISCRADGCDFEISLNNDILNFSLSRFQSFIEISGSRQKYLFDLRNLFFFSLSDASLEPTLTYRVLGNELSPHDSIKVIHLH